jgi:hypothetical protein
MLLLDDFVTINTLRLGVDAQNTVHHEALRLRRPMLAELICRLIVVVMRVGRLRSRSGHRSGEEQPVTPPNPNADMSTDERNTA